MTMRIEGQGHLCECMHWDSLHGERGCTKCGCPAFSGRRGAGSKESAAGASQAPAVCYDCGQPVEWAGFGWTHTNPRHEAKPIFDRADAGMCGDCGKAIHRTSEGILRHSNGPHADHGHAPREWNSGAAARPAAKKPARPIPAYFDTTCTTCGKPVYFQGEFWFHHSPAMLEDAWPEHTARPKEVRGAAASKPALRMSALDECDKCHHTRVMHPVDGLCGVLLFDDQPCNCDHFWPGKGTPCCRCNGSVTASIGCECEHHLVPTTVCPRCQQTFPFITDLREPGGGYMAFHECVPPDTRPATMMQPVDISFDEQTNDNTAGQSIPSDHRMVNLTNVQECDYCGCLIVNPERHQCMARAITNAHREMTKEHDDDTWGL